MNRPKEIERWFHKQWKYTVMADITGNKVIIYLLETSPSGDKSPKKIGSFDTVHDAHAAAWHRHHTIPSSVSTSFKVREKLLRDESQLILLLGMPDITKAQKEVLCMCLDITQDAIADEVWNK